MWALGVALFECCARARPFEGDTQAAFAAAVAGGRRPHVTGYTGDLAALVDACLTLARARARAGVYVCSM